MTSPLFGLIPAGLPAITEPSASPAPTSFLYALPVEKRFDHIVVFLLPNVTLPPNTAASIYLATANDVATAQAQANFKFLGAIGPGKESAMFKVGSSAAGNAGGLVIGVSIEAEDAVGQQLQQLAANKASSTGGSSSQPSTVVLAQRIIQNAFNFLAGFSGTTGPGGMEVVPLKAFEEWWRKFESRVRADPSFLEKQSD